MILAAASVALGLVFVGRLVWQYVDQGLELQQVSHGAVFGLFLIVIGFQTFGFTLLIEMMRRVAR
jgi:hypothetical protein